MLWSYLHRHGQREDHYRVGVLVDSYLDMLVAVETTTAEVAVVEEEVAVEAVVVLEVVDNEAVG